MDVTKESFADVARTLRADAATAEVLTAFQDAGVDALLLKGPTITSWLYGDRGTRHYGDTDVLVSDDRRRQAEAALEALGYQRLPSRQPTAQVGVDHHADEWLRDRDHAFVDLHRTIMGAAAPPERVWQTLWAGHVRLELSVGTARALGDGGRALLVALHAAQHAIDGGQALEDFDRALDVLPAAVWSDAALVAREIEAVPALVAALQTDPRGARLVRDLGLPAWASAVATLRAAGRPGVHTLLRLETARGTRTKLRLLLSETFVRPSALRRRYDGELTRRQLTGIYLTRFWRVVPSVVGYWRHRRRHGDPH